MHVTNCVQKRIKQLLNENNLTMYKLAQYSGIPYTTLKSIIYSDYPNPTIEVIKYICDGFGITLIDFFSSPEFAEPWKHKENN